MIKKIVTVFIILISFSVNSEEIKNIFENIQSTIYVIKIIDKQAGEKISYGSGFTIDSSGYIVTNYHVISDVISNKNTEIIIYNNEGNMYVAELINFNISKDLALLKIEDENLKYINYKKRDINQGEKLYAIGNPKEIRVIIEEGIYNGKLDYSIEERIIFYGNINQGMSGGPSVDEYNNLVGINVSGYGEGVSFLVPAKYAWELYLNRNNKINSFQEELKKQIEIIDSKVSNIIYNSKINNKIFFNKKFNIITNNMFSCWSDNYENNQENTNINTIFENVCSIKTFYYINKNLSFYPLIFRYGFVENTNKYAFLDVKTPEENCKVSIISENKKDWKTILCLKKNLEVEDFFDMRFFIIGTSKRNYLNFYYIDKQVTSKENIYKIVKKVVKEIM